MTEQLTEPLRAAPPEVRAFLATVRKHLGDLPHDEQQELTEDLEADLADLVAERGADVLGDPAVYADELRLAAGHDAAPPTGPAGRGTAHGGGALRAVRQAVTEAVDAAHTSWDRLLDALPGDVGGLVRALQPAWWVVRAWVAWMVAQDVRGPYVVVDGPWLMLLGVFVVLSVQLGRRAWGAGRLLPASLLARLVLVGLNVFAVTMLPRAADRLAWHVAEERAYEYGYVDSRYGANVGGAGITYDGDQVCRLQVRDERGRPIAGASVYDVTGDRTLPLRDRVC